MIYASNTLKQFSQEHNIGYIPLYKKLNESNKKEKPTTWKYDNHLNKKGNEIFAELMFNYLRKKLVPLFRD